jgi:crotonobetainyl-CoA:carnitine CoA-transferase CaiB-like acyl-CoA transferase
VTSPVSEPAATDRLPYHGIRVVEMSTTLTGRLVGLLFADQGAEVVVERSPTHTPSPDDEYLDRGKIALDHLSAADRSSADVLIVDGTGALSRPARQTVLRVTAALPGDEIYGHLAADCSEDLLSALVGIFTDMSSIGRLVGRPVIYTPLPICSVYAAVNGAIAVAAALIDRERCGRGREIVASRLAGGLSAVGILTLTSDGIPEHLASPMSGGMPRGITLDRFQELAREAAHSGERQLWLMQRLAPLASPYRSSDGRMAIPFASANRRLAERLLNALGIWDRAVAAGIVSESAYEPASVQYRGRNLGDPLTLDFGVASALADMLEEAFATRPAAEWEQALCLAGVPCVRIQSWSEWQNDEQAWSAGIFADVHGHDVPQIGRSAWIASAQPYPTLEAVRHVDRLEERAPEADAGMAASAALPLAGFTVVDFCNVVAGPACARMLVELGAQVTKVDTVQPLHSPVIMTTFTGETAVGKRSIILDASTAEGRTIVEQLVASADLIVANKLDDQLARMGMDRDSLARLNPGAIGIQLTAHRGERRGPRHDYPGYDPALQGLTGIMMRFGREGCPTFHGIASCVDYLCGYLGTWAGTTALFARQRRGDGTGDWAEASLAAAASLVQLQLQRQAEPPSARGASATGRSAGERVYRLTDGWIFASATDDMSAELASMNTTEALDMLAARRVAAVPVQTLRQLVERHRGAPSTTVRFERRERDGWVTEGFAPSWFAFDGAPITRPPAAPRVGADAAAILHDLGYTAVEIDALAASRVVGPVEWFARQSPVATDQRG